MSRAGISTKFHMVLTSCGRLVCGFLSGGNVNDITVAAELVRDVDGCFVIGDRGYDSDKFRRELLSGNNVAVIPGRKSRKKAVEYDEKRYKKRGAD